MSAWETAQDAQLAFHRTRGLSWYDNFETVNAGYFSGWGFGPLDYQDKTVLDLCCGPRLRSKFFQNAYIIALDPLAGRYLAEVPGCDLEDANEVITAPAEVNSPGLNGCADLVLCLNSLDQCYDPQAVIGNMARYLKPGGKAFMNFDIRHTPGNMHPLTLEKGTVEQAFRDNGLTVAKYEQEAPHCDLVHYRALYWLVKHEQ
jgi:SAM-dependent methyltransferase